MLDSDPIRQRILAVVDSIPRGRVATYGQVAEEALLPRRARLVGRVLRSQGAGTRLPWQRVVAATGKLALTSTAGREQKRRLVREGIVFSAAGRIDLRRFRWNPG